MRCIAALLTVIALAAAGCGSSDEVAPAACLAGPDAYARALRSAPGAVVLAGNTPISSCLTKNQSAGELTTVGAALVTTATRLNAEARGPGGADAAVRLGYLIGAAQSGAEDTSGIHANLVGRLEAAAGFSLGGEGLPPGVSAAYDRGVSAGRAGG